MKTKKIPKSYSLEQSQIDAIGSIFKDKKNIFANESHVARTIIDLGIQKFKESKKRYSVD